jgi:hypothetical protein
MKIKSATCEAAAEAADATDTFEVALACAPLRILSDLSCFPVFLGPRPVPKDVPSTQKDSNVEATWLPKT